MNTGDRQWFVLYVLVCLEVGFFLMLVPFSAIWEHNYFLDAFPGLRPLVLSPTLRGAVSGLGVANVYLGVAEILNRLHARNRTSEREHVGHNCDTVPSEHDALAAPEEP